MDGYVSKPIHFQDLFDTIDAGAHRRPSSPADPRRARAGAVAARGGDRRRRRSRRSGGADAAFSESVALESTGGDRELLRELIAVFLERGARVDAGAREAPSGAGTPPRCSAWPTPSRGRSTAAAPRAPTTRRWCWNGNGAAAATPAARPPPTRTLDRELVHACCPELAVYAGKPSRWPSSWWSTTPPWIAARGVRPLKKGVGSGSGLRGERA